jgi:MSHA biogenesis protein MshQ
MLGSDSFVTAPAGLCVYSDEVNSDCVSGDAACSVFKAAGASFALKVKGVCWQSAGETNAQFCDNTTTPNFRMDNIALTHTLVAPLSGVAGTLGVSTANISSSGEASVSQSVSEVGVFTFTADPPDDYLGVSGIFTGTTFTSANIGRFIPHHFDVALSPNPPTFADTCTGGGASFTYLGQSFNWAAVPQWTLRAMNTASVLTQNYEGSFWKLADPLSSYSYVDTTVPAGAGPLTPSASSQLLPDTSNCGGTVTMSLTEASGFNYTRPTLSSPISPFAPNVSLTIAQARLTDADNVCYDLGGGAGCQGFEVTGITGNHLRHGQTQVMNNFGPETADITNSPFEVRYYNGTAWIVNDADNCTTGLSFCPSARITDIAPDPVAGGKGTMTVSSLSVPETLPVCPVAPAWLTSLTDCTALDSSCGEFTFGIYRGNDRIINWREVLR